MTRIPTTLGAASPASSGIPRSLNDLDLSTFLNLMIAELQNQDPLNPLDNKDMLAQISQLREVGATDRLTETLDSVLLGQNIASATNLIGADIAALSDDGENIEGIVRRVSIVDNSPKLHVERDTQAAGTGGDGDIEAGTYNYRVVWEDELGRPFGFELSGAKAVTTAGKEGVDQAILISNLPVTKGPKQIYRSGADGDEPYRLVGTVNDGSHGTFVDRLSDGERSQAQLTWWNTVQRSTNISRSYEISLKNVSAIRPPGSFDL
jgi:flagellar basal-body rod modification protein FlgD